MTKSRITKLRAHYNAGRDKVEIFVLGESIERQPQYMRGSEVVLFVSEDPSRECKPSVSLPYDCVQELFDDLWAMGVRPSPRFKANESNEAMKNHLQDMRMIAFSGLGLVKETKDG